MIDTHKLNPRDCINMLPSGCTRNCQQGRHCDCVPDVPEPDRLSWLTARVFWYIYGAALISAAALIWMVLQ